MKRLQCKCKYQVVADHLVKSSGIRPLLHTFAVDVIMEEGKIRLSSSCTSSSPYSLTFARTQVQTLFLGAWLQKASQAVGQSLQTGTWAALWMNRVTYEQLLGECWIGWTSLCSYYCCWCTDDYNDCWQIQNKLLLKQPNPISHIYVCAPKSKSVLYTLQKKCRKLDPGTKSMWFTHRLIDSTGDLI